MSASSSDRPTVRYIMASDLQGKHILDTSAWNALFKDQRLDELLEILGTKVILPTTLSISELAATEDPEKRLALIRLVKTVGKDNESTGALDVFAQGDKGLRHDLEEIFCRLVLKERLRNRVLVSLTTCLLYSIGRSSSLQILKTRLPERASRR